MGKVKYIAHTQIGVFQKDVEVWVDKKLSRMPSAQAGVILKDGSANLISYDTLVCTIDSEGWLTCTGTYSATTRKHIGAFMREYAPNESYCTAKRCYEQDEAYNIRTGEVMPMEKYAKLVSAA